MAAKVLELGVIPRLLEAHSHMYVKDLPCNLRDSCVTDHLPCGCLQDGFMHLGKEVVLPRLHPGQCSQRKVCVTTNAMPVLPNGGNV